MLFFDIMADEFDYFCVEVLSTVNLFAVAVNPLTSEDVDYDLVGPWGFCCCYFFRGLLNRNLIWFFIIDL